ncbi:MAG: GH24 family phage-related lysozyme (muramidase) [Yoonia sp.]|jgi:GH24 family phage-related lysozyme (muramidase)
MDKDRQIKHCRIGTGQCHEPDLNRQANQTSPGKANPTMSMTIKATTPKASAKMVSRERAITDLISSVI